MASRGIKRWFRDLFNPDLALTPEAARNTAHDINRFRGSGKESQMIPNKAVVECYCTAVSLLVH